MITGLASSWDGDRIAYSKGGDGPVQLWDLNNFSLVAQFETILQPGGSRLGVSPNGRLIAAGAYARKGLAVYDGTTGACLWRRSDITKVQQVGFGPTGTAVWCVSDIGPARILEATTGLNIREIPRVRWMGQSHIERQALVFDGKRYKVIDDSVTLLGTGPDSKPLDGTVGNGSVCLSEVGGPLRYFALRDGREIHRIDPENGCHWTGVGYCADGNRFVVTKYPYTQAGEMTLQLLDPKSGGLIDVVPLASPKYVFCRRGTLALGSHGDLLETENGTLIHHFGWFSP